MNERLKDPNEMSFLDHLEDLRWHILRSFLAIVFFGFIAFIFKVDIYVTIIIFVSNIILFHS